MKCEICGKEYKRRDFFEKHMEQHRQSGQRVVADSNAQILEAIKLMQERIDLLQAKLDERENAPTTAELRGTIDEHMRKKREAVANAPVVKVLNDEGEPVTITVNGYRCVLDVGDNEVPEPIARAWEDRKRAIREGAERDAFIQSWVHNREGRTLGEMAELVQQMRDGL